MTTVTAFAPGSRSTSLVHQVRFDKSHLKFTTTQAFVRFWPRNQNHGHRHCSAASVRQKLRDTITQNTIQRRIVVNYTMTSVLPTNSSKSFVDFVIFPAELSEYRQGSQPQWRTE